MFTLSEVGRLFKVHEVKVYGRVTVQIAGKYYATQSLNVPGPQASPPRTPRADNATHCRTAVCSTQPLDLPSSEGALPAQVPQCALSPLGGQQVPSLPKALDPGGQQWVLELHL